MRSIDEHESQPEERFGVSFLPRRIMIGVVRVYQSMISPMFPPSCRFTPTCSQYAIEALREYGLLKGMVLSLHRVLRCNPWGGFGYDPPRWYTERELPKENEHTVDDQQA